MSDINERTWRALVREHGRTKAAKMMNEKIQNSSWFKIWKMRMEKGDKNV